MAGLPVAWNFYTSEDLLGISECFSAFVGGRAGNDNSPPTCVTVNAIVIQLHMSLGFWYGGIGGGMCD